MRRTLQGILLTAAFVMVVVPLLFRDWSPNQPSPMPHAASNERLPGQEAVYKQKIVQNDVAATEKLSRAQTVADIRRYLSNGEFTVPEMKRLMTVHPEMRLLEWTDGNKKHATESATVPAALWKASAPYWEAGRQAIRHGKSYTSPLFADQGKSYYVMAHASASPSHSGLISLISSEVIQSVERHQRRNMRLIPYPAEGRYRVESVVPNTLKDTTVRKGEDNGNASHYSVDEVVVKFRTPLTDAQLLQLRKSLDLIVVRQTRRQTYVFRSKKHKTEELIAYFNSEWNPIYAEPHYLYLTNELPEEPASEGTIVPNDTLYSEYQWNLPQIATESGWSVSKGSDDIVVAVIDTGVQADHPDLQGRLVEGVNIVDPSSPPEDDVGHGTHVAGIISASVNNREGVAGMTWYTKIMPIKALDSTGAGSTYSVAEGVLWAVDHGADVINMSLGNYAQAEFLHDALKYAYDHGVVLVAASGNDNTDRPGFPAAYPEVLAVAATDPDKSRAEYSNYGDYIDIAAPGTSIPSTYPGSRYAALSGTSMACPHVAALASLVRAVNPQLNNEEVMDVLRRTARDLGPEGKDDDFGYGEIDVKSALQSVSGASASLQLYPTQVRRQLERLNSQ
ncbi:S8 family peptidase [Cohnella panacarvi]|uniref:S8 family peptidase n=1 Tax=Cohnella panacarvi TaxID=400776 RepID=UPI0004789D9C|nr:S8 family peptidase [Cohnella panacarvi]